jgi:hypothetical protein
MREQLEAFNAEFNFWAKADSGFQLLATGLDLSFMNIIYAMSPSSDQSQHNVRQFN